MGVRARQGAVGKQGGCEEGPRARLGFAEQSDLQAP